MDDNDIKKLLGELGGIRAALENLLAYLARPIMHAESALDELNEEHDELYEDAKKAVLRAGKASTSYLQQKLGIGYARAAKLIDLLEERGVIGPALGARPRQIIHRLTPDVIATLEKIEKQLKKKKKKN